MTTAQQLDPPWPGDESIEEWQQRRAKLLAELSDDQIRDMVCDALDDVMIDVLRRHVFMTDMPRTPEAITTGNALNNRLVNAREAYLEANE